MKIIIESHIPFVDHRVFEGIAEVVHLDPEDITAQIVKDADALIVRTRTRCNADLLEGSRVRFVATATIGTDHIDHDYCRNHAIETVSAPGCNAPAVAQYVWSSVLRLDPSWRQKTIGIVGLGNVGSIVARWGKTLGAKVIACDPLRRQAEGGWDAANPRMAGSEPFVDLETLAAQADIVTLHTPHTVDGPCPTHHLVDERFLSLMRPGSRLINAARGPVVDTPALLKALTASQSAGRIAAPIIDCWEGEPAISQQLLSLCAIATPHIAGYSIEGKQRATAMAVAAALRHFHAIRNASTAVGQSTQSADTKAIAQSADAEAVLAAMPPQEHPGVALTPELIVSSYDPLADTEALRANPSPAAFESLRNHYPLRHEPGF